MSKGLFLSWTTQITQNQPNVQFCVVARALSDRAKNVCSSPELLAEEMDHLGKVLKYNNYPKWMIDQPAETLIWRQVMR